MKIVSFHIKNFKSFDDSGIHGLAPSMNVIVGQNNVGKTALLEALSNRISSKPHRDATLPTDERPIQISSMNLTISLSGRQLKSILLDSGASQFKIPVLESVSGDLDAFVADIFRKDEIVVAASLSATSDGRSWSENTTLPSDYNNRGLLKHTIVLNVDKNSRTFPSPFLQGNSEDTISAYLCSIFHQKVYFFDAHRTPRSIAPFGAGLALSPDASNLAEVLGVFQASPSGFRQYIEQVRRVIPSVKWVSIEPTKTGGAQQEILIWNVDEDQSRSHLAVPLSECGAGVGQVLAILYVVAKSAGDILIIDEPNSFLHPGAAKNLMEILRESHGHQIIVSTHAPEVVTSSRPQQILSLRLDDGKTKISPISEQSIDDARQVLAELGSRLSDIFGYDKVVWVEGPTEVQSFPLIARDQFKSLANRTTFAQLRSTGDLEGKHAQVIADIYRNLCAAQAILPEPIGIILDGDKRGNSKLDALERAFPNTIKYLPRYTFENFLFHPVAITAVMNELPTFKDAPLQSGIVEGWLHSKGNEEKYGCFSQPVLSDDWLTNVNATLVFKDMFEEISEAKEIHRKPQHSVAIVRWIVDNDAMFLEPLKEFLEQVIPL